MQLDQMQSIRSVLFRYLDAKQYLWNTNFVDRVTNLRDCEPLDSFEAIDRLLFGTIVCQPLKIALPANFIRGGDPVVEIGVRARSGLSELPVTLSRSIPENDRTWTSLTSYRAGEMEFTFIDFFQWSKYDFLSMSSVRCFVTKSDSEPAYVGRRALIETANVEFFCAANRLAD